MVPTEDDESVFLVLCGIVVGVPVLMVAATLVVLLLGRR